MKIAFVTSECTGWIKTGGLGDVSAALPAALRGFGHDVRVLIPGYREVLARAGETGAEFALQTSAGFPAASLVEARLPSGVPAWILRCPSYYEREAGPYLDAQGKDFPDNALRFGLLAWAGARLGAGLVPGWRPDLVHGHDWQAALVPAYLKYVLRSATPFVQTLHNLAFQGLFEPDRLEPLGLPPSRFTPEGWEFYGKLSFLKAGIVEAELVTTVSPTYALEIREEKLGFGLHGTLSAKGEALVGILNGIDAAEWDCSRDPCLARVYDASSIEAKRVNKLALQRAMGLEAREDVPLAGIVSRLTHQKGTDLIVDAAPRLLAQGLQIAALGAGDRDYERALSALAAAHPGRAAVQIGFDEALAHRIEAGADFFLMPSRFEPCGLNQMYSQRYGTPPVVRRTGGLADTVVDCTPAALSRDEATGFVFEAETAEAFAETVERALAAYRDRPRWRALQLAGMRRDFGWTGPARQYEELFARLVRAAAS